MTEPAAAPGAAGTPGSQVLLLAQPLLRQGLGRLLAEASPPCRVAGEPSELEGAPQLVIWSLEAPIHPGNLLLEQSRREVLEFQLQTGRMLGALDRIAESRVLIQEPVKVTPLAFPLLVDKLRERVSSETLGDRIARMQAELEQGAG